MHGRHTTGDLMDPAIVPGGWGDLTCCWFTNVLRSSAHTARAMGAHGYVRRRIGPAAESDNQPRLHGKTGALIVRVRLEYGRLPRQIAERPPRSVVVKLSSRAVGAATPGGGGGRAAWIADQDVRESRFHHQSRAQIRTPQVYFSRTSLPSTCVGIAHPSTGVACAFRCCIVMEDLTASHVSGEDVAMLMYRCENNATRCERYVCVYRRRLLLFLVVPGQALPQHLGRAGGGCGGAGNGAAARAQLVGRLCASPRLWCWAGCARG
jgi:hypothetical protein|eukprot:COSAG01_NODE_780_length_13660_cov_171.194233_2_plen_265_part_00